MKSPISILLWCMVVIPLWASPFVGNNGKIVGSDGSHISSRAWLGNHSVLVIRTEFPADNDPLTYGDGRFILRTLADRNPKNMDYFTIFSYADVEPEYVYENGTNVHTYSLRDYFREISNDLFDLNDIVMTEIVVMPHAMSYYDDPHDTASGYSRLIKDALAASGAYADREYDFIVVLHAGAGEESDMSSTTPNDILSGVLTAEEYFEKTGQLLQYGAFNPQSVIILPETQTRGNLKRGLLGSAAFTFGQAMGMPLTFNMNGQSSGLGLWDLMAYGLWNYNGFAPMHPTAYTKILMGWASVTEVAANGTFLIHASAADLPNSMWTGNQVLKIHVNSNEYFLIENRERTGIEKYFENGYSVTELGMNGSGKMVIRETCTPMGVMVYHIRHDVIEQIPATPISGVSKGIDIEEADGFNDLDKPWGQTGSIGDVYDCFSDSVLKKFRWTRFNDKTNPSANDAAGRRTGIVLSNIHSDILARTATITIENTRRDYFPFSFNEGVHVGNGFFVTENGVVTALSDNAEIHTFSADEQVVHIRDTLIFTSHAVYQVTDCTTALAVFPFAAQTITREGVNWYVLGENNVLCLSESFQTIASQSYTGAERSILHESSWYNFKSNAWYLHDTRLGEQLCIYEDRLYYSDGGDIYQMNNDHPERVLTLSDVPKDFFFADYDSDGTAELFASFHDNVIIYTPNGYAERVLPLKNVSFMTIARDNGGLFLFSVGDAISRYDWSKEGSTYFTHVGTPVIDTVTEETLLYHDSSLFYSFPGFITFRTGNVAKKVDGEVTPLHNGHVYVYPNPSSSSTVTVFVKAELGETAEISLFSARMHKIKNISRQLIGGENYITLDVSDLATGTYFCVVSWSGHTSRLKLSILR